MKANISSIVFVIIQFFLNSNLLSQTNNFDVITYQKFLGNNKNLSTENLLKQFNAGLFIKNLGLNCSTVKNFVSIDNQYKFTNYEKLLIGQNGFMVTERLSYPTFMVAYNDIYKKDLPVFISSDAILHAMHMSYDLILSDIEDNYLIYKLDTLLSKLHEQLPKLADEYSSNQKMLQILQDFDLYITFPRKILHSEIKPFYEINTEAINKLIVGMNNEYVMGFPLFGTSIRMIDFSQFKPRGHYTLSVNLTKYFKAMMWLGRTEINLSKSVNVYPSISNEDVKRQTMLASLISEAMVGCDGFQLYDIINDLIQLFVGEQDNVTIYNLSELLNANQIQKTDQLLDISFLNNFQKSLASSQLFSQKILSQIIATDINSPENIVLPSAFLLFGQRFLIDAYVTDQVVNGIYYYDKKIFRKLPSTLDILFSLGNNASGQLLKPELDKYHYSQNLAALRYLSDSYDPDFWNSTFYNLWLNSIRKLNPSENRSKFPKFMQTAAWWQEKMNTQLASWAELRHDNLLYAKQSYSAGLCSFPTSYVEPFPEFYSEIKNFASKANNYFKTTKYYYTNDVVNYFINLESSCSVLSSIAQKELNRIPLTNDENTFLKSMLNSSGMCGAQNTGWYPKMFYGERNDHFSLPNYVVADVHTAPTDELGLTVGNVLHCGVGPINMGLFIAETTDSLPIAYIGPVISYYENVTNNFYRYSDKEWETVYVKPSSYRPSFVNTYLANSVGDSKGTGPSLLTSIQDKDFTGSSFRNISLSQNYPNPFNPSTTIKFSIPSSNKNSRVLLNIYDLQGRLVKNLINREMIEGTYNITWDGIDNNGRPVSGGIYFYHLIVGNNRISGKMNLVK